MIRICTGGWGHAPRHNPARILGVIDDGTERETHGICDECLHELFPDEGQTDDTRGDSPMNPRWSWWWWCWKPAHKGIYVSTPWLKDLIYRIGVGWYR